MRQSKTPQTLYERTGSHADLFEQTPATNIQRMGMHPHSFIRFQFVVGPPTICLSPRLCYHQSQ